jgi:hypothetical protein
MKLSITFPVSCLLLIAFTSFHSKNTPIKLLDKNLSQWEMYQSYRHNEMYNGQIPKDANGKDIQPIGYNKNEGNVFSVKEENGNPVLRISGEIYGCLFTKQEFENYDLKLKVKWGVLK